MKSKIRTLGQVGLKLGAGVIGRTKLPVPIP